jgi:Ca-activated chloride channel homolog
MALDGGVAIDVFEAGEEATRGLGAIWARSGARRQLLPLARVAVAASVADRIAQVTVTQVFRNTFTDPIEAVYTFPLAAGSVVSRFEMQVGDRTLHGIVAERGTARDQYQQALEQGRRAALLEQERDDVFTIQLGNLPPGEDATIRLTYSEELTFFDDGLTELRLPLVLGVRYVPGDPLPGESAGHGTDPDTSIVPDASRITPPRLADGFDPGVHLTITVDIAAEAIADLACSQHATRVATGDDHVIISLARGDERLNRDFVLRWRVAKPGGVRSTLFFYRRPSGERYAVASVMASATPGQPRARDVDVIFVLDHSGSMEGPKMASAARACGILLGTLGPADRFALLAFNERAEWLTGDSEPLVPADRAGIARGEHLLREVQANGGTELYPALQTALSRMGRHADTAGRVPVLVLITDGAVGDESRALELLQRAKARVFTVGVDTSVNSGLLKRMAQAGGGTFVLTEPGAGLDDALGAIAREIGAPLVEDLAIALDGGTATEVAPERLPDLFAGRAATIAFRADTGQTVHITGRHADGSALSIDVPGMDVDLPAIAHLWARRRITDLEDRHRLGRADRKAIEAEIVALSTSHGVLSRFTAFVVVDDRQAVVSTAERRTIVQPVEMPHMWTSAVARRAVPDSGDPSVESLMTFGAPAGSARLRMSAPRFLSRRLNSAGEPPAAHPPDQTPPQEVTDLVDRLLPLLRKLSAGGPAHVERREALAIVERLLGLLGASRRSRHREPLISALQTLRDRLQAAAAAEREAAAAALALTDVWSQLAPLAKGRGRFWDTV